MRSVFICAVAVLVSWPVFARPKLSECDGYAEKSRELGCSNRGYLLKFGYRYCREFVRRNDDFTEFGQDVLAKIRRCLLDKIETEPGLTCRNVKSKAQDHHVECYVKSGYCELNLGDKWTIADIVWDELNDPGFEDTTNRILDECKIL